MRYLTFISFIFLLLAGCTKPRDMESPTDDALVLRERNIITEEKQPQIFTDVLITVNALREQRSLEPVFYHPALIEAAQKHSADMLVQSRAWHFGSDKSSPIDRVRREEYPGILLGEVVSETFETEIDTIASWMREPGTREVLLDLRATDMGLGFAQEADNTIWWTLVMGGAGKVQPVSEIPDFVSLQQERERIKAEAEAQAEAETETETETELEGSELLDEENADEADLANQVADTNAD